MYSYKNYCQARIALTALLSRIIFFFNAFSPTLVLHITGNPTNTQRVTVAYLVGLTLHFQMYWDGSLKHTILSILPRFSLSH